MSEEKIIFGLIAWLSGILATVIVQLILNRRRVLSYFTDHQKVGMSADDKTFGNIQIIWNNSPVQNLYLSTIELLNESSKDLQDVKIRVYTNNTLLLTEFPVLVGTTEFVRHSPEYQKELEIPPGKAPTEAQINTYRTRRDYFIPVLNRRQTVRFQYLNASQTSDPPWIFLECIHHGVVIKYRPPQTIFFGVERRIAVITGTIAGIVFVSALVLLSPSPWLTGIACFFYGAVVEVPGAGIVKVLRAIRRWIAG